MFLCNRMLHFTPLEDAYIQPLANTHKRKKKQKDGYERPMSSTAVIDQNVDNIVDSTPEAPVAPIVDYEKPKQQEIKSPRVDSALGGYIGILVIVLFTGMLYDMRACLVDIRHSLHILTKENRKISRTA